ncbi:hypothetical protein [Pseudonocardia sp. N23]|uniref:hypothetical protein n=1 Tax=Pseudonocardia sp. N23 TaxID=1987376 RepID=UPI000BFCEAAD|nr:hypothetical protein [Pseudonocardia sp. N23]RTL63175.1 MAG: hypothetical protein EKK42_29290 [Pseudonocardiaceae bacterium]GAY08599.1 hypothetical protein TOK_2356 [Pseudonocardia sp. N23]
MFEMKDAVPDVLDSMDPAVRRCDPPVPVWVDLAALTQQQRYGRGSRRGGVFVGGAVRAIMWAQIMTERGFWLAVLTCELERGGRPILTAPAVVPEWAITRRRAGSERRLLGKAGDRPTLVQTRAQRRPGGAARP